MIEFKFPALESEFEQLLHPAAKDVVIRLALHSNSHGYSPPVVTCIYRAPSDSLEVGKFGWHQVACAVDLRSIHYTPAEKAGVIQFLNEQCMPKVDWELITKPHGTGPHFHVARRDFQWKATFKR